MSRSFPADTRVQNFLVETYNKERDTRLGWYMKSLQEGQPRQSKQLEVFKKNLEAACPKPTAALLELKHAKPKSYHRRVIRDVDLIPPVKVSKDKLSVDMLPVDKPIKQLLYDGFTKEGKGRYRYLHERYHDIPEVKYQFPVLSSWDYGWRLSDIIKKQDIKKPVNGRTRIVHDTFYTRTGIPGMPCSAIY